MEVEIGAVAAAWTTMAKSNPLHEPDLLPTFSLTERRKCGKCGSMIVTAPCVSCSVREKISGRTRDRKNDQERVSDYLL